MNKGLVIRLMICIFGFSLFLYSYVDKQNTLTGLRIELPFLSKEIRALQEENTRLQYEIDQFENPSHLIELARHSEFAHLKHPYINEVLTVSEGAPMQMPSEEKDIPAASKTHPSVFVGAR